MTRIDEVIDNLLNEKRHTYGDDILDRIADSWGRYLEIDLTDVDVSLMMLLMKIERFKQSLSHKKEAGVADSAIDILGYAKLFYSSFEGHINGNSHNNSNSRNL